MVYELQLALENPKVILNLLFIKCPDIISYSKYVMNNSLAKINANQEKKNNKKIQMNDYIDDYFILFWNLVSIFKNISN